MQVKATGNLEKVIKESTDVATSVAWNYIPEDTKEKFMEMWKNKPMGFHIHCPDGATPKDGPSAGGALTLAIYSLLTHRKIQNNVAMTGEINLQGRISAIGGLEEKLEGAKKAGCVLALVPKENNYDLTKIVDRNPSLLDDKFTVILIENFGDIIKNALLPSSPTDTPFVKTYYGNDNFDELII
jgi:ATP-dependent Lon protease